MSLERLFELAPPTGQRDGIPDLAERWAEVERKLGLTLPTSYKNVASIYGDGMFGGWIRFRDILMGTDWWITYVRKHYDYGRDKRNPGLHRLYPEPGGLFPWALDDNSGQLCWLTSGHPDSWPIVLLDNYYEQQDEYGELTIDEFLVGWLEGRLKSPSHYPISVPKQPAFVP